MKKLKILFFILFVISSCDTIYSLTLPAPTILTTHCDTLFWTRSAGATSYRLQLAIDSNFSTIILSVSNITDTFYVFQSNLTCYARVKAKSSTDSSNWSSIAQVTFSTGPLAPTLLSPPNGGITYTSIDTFRWNASTVASSYRFQLAYDSLFINLLVNDSTITTTSRIVSGLVGAVSYYWRVNAKNLCGTSSFSPVWHFYVWFEGILQNSNEIPDKFELFQNYPNPFNPITKIKFSIPQSSVEQTFLSVFDILGREVATLVNEKLSPGTYEVEWDASNYPSSVYFYKLQTETFSEVKKMVLMK